jgi:hypothetical protein
MLSPRDTARVLDHLEQLRDDDPDRGERPRGVLASRVHEALKGQLDPSATPDDVRAAIDGLVLERLVAWRDQARPAEWGLRHRVARYFHATPGGSRR